jgi:hypothetical protein
MDNGALSPEVQRPGMKLTSHLLLLPRLKIYGPILPFTLHGIHRNIITFIFK